GNDYIAITGLLRADSSLGQIGPFPIGLSPGLGGRTVITAVAAIDTVTASGNATGDFTTGGNRGLFYYENYNTNTDGTPAVNAGFGSRVVFSSFGLEGISQDYYRFDVNGVPFYSVRNQRAHVLNNVVTYLRTGAFTGRITQASGQGVPGATVYIRPNGGLPGPRQLFSATSNFDGSFTIAGVEPGNYTLTAYKSGFTTSTSNVSFGVEADTTTNASLVLAPVPPGRIQGTVKDSVTGLGVPGVTVTFKSTDGQTTVFAVTGADGTYTIDNVPAGVYNGSASKQPQFQDATAPNQGNPVTVPSGGTAPADFSIVSNPATVSGVVFNDIDGDGNRGAGEPGIAGATVTFTPTQGAGTPVSATSGADGSYTVTVSGGTYNVTVTAPGFRASAPRNLVVQPGDARKGFDLPLIPAPVIPNGTLGGLVTDGFTKQPLTGVTITVTDATGAVVASAPTGTAASPAAPQGDGQALNYGPISLPAGTYTVAATRAGFTGQTLTGVIVASGVFTRADFSAATGNPLQPLNVFPAGLNFVSFPYDYASAGVTFDTLFGGLNPSPRSNPSAGGNRSHVYVWQPQLLQYVADPTPPADMPRLGQGYWVFLINGAETFGVANRPTAAAISVGLRRGWNMIGVPSLTAVSVSRLTFVSPAGTGAITFDQAASSTFKLVSPTLYGFDGANYVPVTSGGALQPYKAYWIYAFVDTTIQIPTTGG
nr:carboxypeptidase regulatory-like domain-containing protein [Armatimonadota bacterium]